MLFISIGHNFKKNHYSEFLLEVLYTFLRQKYVKSISRVWSFLIFIDMIFLLKLCQKYAKNCVNISTVDSTFLRNY